MPQIHQIANRDIFVYKTNRQDNYNGIVSYVLCFFRIIYQIPVFSILIIIECNTFLYRIKTRPMTHDVLFYSSPS